MFKVGKRIFLFVIINILIITTISIVAQLLGVQPHLTERGLDLKNLAFFALLWGMGASLISLALSRIMAKWMMGVRLIDERSANPEERWLHQTVKLLAQRAKLKGTPQVGIYDSPEMNAFATGPTERRSLVAVSSGLLQRMDKDEVEGVLAHEVAHIANGDMVTMTLVQGVMNAFVIFISRALAHVLAQNVREESRPMVFFITTLVLQILLSIAAMFVVAGVSRAREYRADRGGAQLAGRTKMARALKRLQLEMSRPQVAAVAAEPAVDTLKISGRGGWLKLLSTHPPLEERILRLETASDLRA